MNVLLINGSPKGKRSNSLRLANSFIEGFKEGYKSKNEAVSIDGNACSLNECRSV